MDIPDCCEKNKLSYLIPQSETRPTMKAMEGPIPFLNFEGLILLDSSLWERDNAVKQIYLTDNLELRACLSIFDYSV